MNLAAKSLVTLAVVMVSSAFASAQQKGESVTESSPKPDASLTDQVKKAFAAVRQGDYEGVVALADRAKETVPLLAPYVADAHVDVRREVVSLLKASGDPRAVPLLVEMLGDGDRVVQESAAAALYHGFDPQKVAGQPGAAEGLAKAAGSGHTESAAVLLLLAYLPGPDTVDALKKVRQTQADRRTKLLEWTAHVPVPLAVNVALARLGDEEARRDLLGTIKGNDLHQRQFLLGVIREIDAPGVLRALSVTLDDTRRTGTGAISGTQSPRRLCDDAVDAFVKRLDLTVDFPLAEGQVYTEAQTDQVRRKIREALPQ